MSFTDAIRAMVPRSLRKPVRKLYACVPMKKRLGREYGSLKAFLRDAQWWDRIQIEAWQLQKLKEVIAYADKNVPGYYDLYREAGIKPDDITSIADVGHLPFTSKELIRDNLKDFTSRAIPSRELHYLTTGGSTGIPFGFYQTRTNLWMENAFMHSGWERVGWHVGDSSAVLRGAFVGSGDDLWDDNPASRELLLSSYYLTERTYDRYVGKILEYRPQHLQAYPSAAMVLADLITAAGDVGRIRFEILLLGSENLYGWQLEKLRRAFTGARLFSWYGHAEEAVLAPWCETAQQAHAWPFYGLTEVLGQDNQPVEKGEIGEIIGTSFWDYGTPFIRYRTMDRAQYGGIGCEQCGRQFPILDRLEGRLQEIIVTHTGRYISMTAINMHSDLFDNVRQFQFYQDAPGRVVLRLACKGSYTEQDTAKIMSAIGEKLGTDTELELVFVDQIARTQRGKYRFLDQKLAIRYGDR